MKSPCTRDCPDRSITPNCHGTCERYLEYNAERERIRAKKAREHEAIHALVIGAQKIRLNAFRKK